MKTLDDIINHFDSDDDDNDEDMEYEMNNNKNENRNSTPILVENESEKIKQKLLNIQNENEQKNNNRQPRRDIFGYFINDENEENESDESNSNNKEQNNNSYRNSDSSKKSLNVRNSNKEEENEILDKEENIDNQDFEINNDKDNNNEKILYENECDDENKEKNDLINELYISNHKHDYLDSIEGEAFRMNSFKPIPIPGSPKFTNKVSINDDKNNNINSNKIENNKDIKYDTIENNNNINNNEINNIPNFTETIETKIEGEGDISKETPIINDQIYNNLLYTHNNNIISLGYMPNKDNLNISESNQNINFNNNKTGEQKYKSIEEEEQEEEAFLRREELKREKYYEKIKNEKNENVTEKNVKKRDEKEDDGKENVTEDEEESGTQNFNKLEIKENLKIKKNNENLSNNCKENIKEELTEDEEDNLKINNINKNNKIKKQCYNEINDIKKKDISIKLIEQYKKADNNQKEIKKKLESNSSNNYNYRNYESLSSLRNSKNMNINKKNNIPYVKNITSEKNINKKNIIPIPISKKKSKCNSPYSRNKKNNNENNYFSENNKQISTINKNTTFQMDSNYSNYNSNFSKKNTFKNKNDLESIKKKLYNPKDKIKSNKKMYSSESYSFLPKINKKSKKICNKKNINNKRSHTPIGVLLYEDANYKKEKMNQICLTENNNIISNANSKKINDKSYNMAIERINKKIDNAIKKFSITGKLSIVGMTQCLYELNIITELIKIKDNIQENINDDLDLVELQSIIESINKKDLKKLKEIEFLEQLWFIINPNQTQYINSKILSELLKILFSSNNNIKNLANNIEKIFNKYKISINKNNEDNENVNDDEDELYTSSLREKKYNKNELWSLPKFIKTFLDIKKDLKAYKDNDYQKGDVYNNIIKERDKDLTFQPEFRSNTFFYKHSKYNYNNDNSIIDSKNTSNISNYSSKRQKHDFDKVYERFMAERDLHEKTLERIREIKRQRETKMCTNVPKINKYIPKSPDKKLKNKTIESEESKILKKNDSTFEIKVPRFKILYNMRKDLTDKSNKTILDENYTFRPVLTSNNEIMNKTFSNMKNFKKPKGYNEYVQRNRAILEKKESEKKKEEDKKYGKNYEKIQKMKFKPLKITDLNQNNIKNKKKVISIPSSDNNRSNRSNRSEEQNIKNDFMSNLENDKRENIIDDIYINIDIKIPNGLLKPLKIYNRNDNDTVEMVNAFCKIYSINDENKNTIIKKVIQYKNAFFNTKLNQDNNKDGFILNEDSDIITNAYSNNSGRKDF